MLWVSGALLVLAVFSTVECVRNTPRSARASRNEASLEFECPEEFGYYPHPRDCTQYYVCVFGGALLESCTGGLMYSHELQTCDWPRNVGCLGGGSIAKETEEDDPLLERAAKAESIQLEQQQQHRQQQQQSRQHQRQPIQRQNQPQQITVTSSSPPVSQITERQSRQRQQQQPQHHQRTYQDDEYEPATEVESDRQQRVYRGQPSTIGQVQRDRDGLRRNIISVSHPTSSSSSSSSPSGAAEMRQHVASSNNNIVNQGSARSDRFDNGQQNDYESNPTTDPASRRSRIHASSIDGTTDHRQLEYSSVPRHSELDERLDDTISVTVTSTSSSTSAMILQGTKAKTDSTQNTESSDRLYQDQPATSRIQTESTILPTEQNSGSEVPVTTTKARSTLQQPRSRSEEGFPSPSPVPPTWQRSTDDLEKNEISATAPSPFRLRSTAALVPDEIRDNERQQNRYRNDGFSSSSTPSWLRSTEELERNEISVSPGPAGRGFMIKRLRSDLPDSYDDREIPVTMAYARQRQTTNQIGQHERGESRTLEVSVSPPSIRHRSRNTVVPSPFQQRIIEKSTIISDSSAARRNSFADPENRKYYVASIHQRSSEDTEVSAIPDKRLLNGDPKSQKIAVQLNSSGGSLENKKYYIPSVQQHRYSSNPEVSNSSTDNQDRKTLSADTENSRTTEVPANSILKTSGQEKNISEKSVQKVAIVKNVENNETNGQEDPAGNEITVTPSSIRRNSISTSSTGEPNETEGNEIPKSYKSPGGIRGRQRVGVRGQSQHKTQDGLKKSSRPEREKDSYVNSRAQTDSHYRAISSESPRIAKTTASTAAPVSKAYYSDADQSYPYYTIYDDDVSIYKDDDYSQYTVNHTVQIQQQQQQQQPHHHQHQHQNVRIAEVTPNSNQYSQKPKKVPVNDADKYNLSPEVTVSDYDIYDTQPLKNKFRIPDGHQSLRTNGLSHPVVHVTTPNAIVDTYVPLTTTTQPPPTTTARPYTVTVQNRGRPQVNRGPPRSRPTLKPSTAIVSKAQEFVDIYRYPPVRPGPIYPTPTVDKPAAKCRKDVCLLPDCSCGGSDIPGDYLPEEIPQIVLLTFDDSVNDLNKGLYADLFEKGRKNPNGCPISATFYVSHEWTDYSQVQNLYANGHEIASHTVSHSFGEQFSARKWAREVAGQREILAAYGGVKLEDVRGMRAPFLSVGGNNMFKMLWDTNFTYDSSMPIYENRPPSWPYTLDYKLFHDCMIPPCPTRSYPGLWEVPMVMWQDLNGGRCSMGDACSNPPTPDGVYKMLIKNFERHYTTNRAPFGLFYHAAWFTQPHHKEGFISFLDTIVAMDDVWVVTNWQALQWVRNPTPLGLLDSFEPFSCNHADRPKKCNNPKVCNLWHKSGVRYMKTCQPCPDIYPWTGKTGIRSSRIDNEVEK